MVSWDSNSAFSLGHESDKLVFGSCEAVYTCTIRDNPFVCGDINTKPHIFSDKVTFFLYDVN